MTKFVGKVICLMLVGTLSVNAFAGTIDDILYAYGKIPEAIDTTELVLELSNVEESYEQAVTECKRNEYLNIVDQVISESKESLKGSINIKELQNDVQSKKLNLIQLVQNEATLEEILQAENSYKKSLETLSTEVDKTKYYDNSSYKYESLATSTTYQDVENLSNKMNELIDRLAELEIKDDIGDTDNIPSPTQGVYNKTSGYGTRGNPFGTSDYEVHYGLDLAAPEGSNIISIFNGTVLTSDYNNSLGNYIIVAHSEDFQTLYGHMSKRIAEVGDVVKQGDIIGLVGSTGRSTGPHCHLGVYIQGEKQDPEILYK